MRQAYISPKAFPLFTALLLFLLLSASTCAELPIAPNQQNAGDVGVPLLVDLYIPGTHDSGAINGLAMCQDIDLSEQLSAGIRAFDLRLVDRYDGSGKMDIYHGIVRYPLELTEDILPLFVRFLEQNPEEFLLLTLRKEDDRNDSPEHYASYGASLLRALKVPEVLPHLYVAPLTLRTTKSDLAGKMVILSRNEIEDDELPLAHYRSFGDDCTSHTVLEWSGRDWSPFPLLIEDDYKVKDIIHKSDKKEAIHSAITVAAQEPSDALNIFFLSGSAPALPLNVAKTINPYTSQLIRDMKRPPAGVYFIDFSGRPESRELIDHLRSLNTSMPTSNGSISPRAADRGR